MAVACIIKDTEGRIMDFFGKKVVTLFVVCAEVQAVRESYIFAIKAGVSLVFIEGDCANVLNWCKVGGSDPPGMSPFLIWDIRSSRPL